MGCNINYFKDKNTKLLINRSIAKDLFAGDI